MPDNQTPVDLESFDDLFVGNPIDIERNLKALLPAAAKLKDQSIYLQIMSQVALAQAVNNHENDPFGGRLKWTTWRSSKMDHLAVTQNDPPARR